MYNCNWEGENVYLTSGITKYQKEKQNLAKIQWKNVRNIKFLPANKQFRQNLAIMIMCSQRPVKITALKFSTLSFQSFTAILSTSMSYFTLLQTVYNENKEELQQLA